MLCLPGYPLQFQVANLTLAWPPWPYFKGTMCSLPSMKEFSTLKMKIKSSLEGAGLLDS